MMPALTTASPSHSVVVYPTAGLSSREGGGLLQTPNLLRACSTRCLGTCGSRRPTGVARTRAFGRRLAR
eukprot:7705606-Alexandrium_andersonii.AAC.1